MILRRMVYMMLMMMLLIDAGGHCFVHETPSYITSSNCMLVCYLLLATVLFSTCHMYDSCWLFGLVGACCSLHKIPGMICMYQV